MMKLRFVLKHPISNTKAPSVVTKLLRRISKYSVGVNRLESVIYPHEMEKTYSCVIHYNDDLGELTSLALDASSLVAFKMALYKLENRLVNRLPMLSQRYHLPGSSSAHILDMKV